MPVLVSTSTSHTNSWRLISDTGLLPDALAATLMDLPKTPLTPVLLLVGGICAMIATGIYLWSLFSLTHTADEMRAKLRDMSVLKRRSPIIHAHTHMRRSSMDSTNSATILMQWAKGSENQSWPFRDDGKAKVKKCHYAFLVFGIPSFGLSLAAAGIQLAEVRQAQKTWSETEARRVGMRFDLGCLTYRECCNESASLTCQYSLFFPSSY